MTVLRADVVLLVDDEEDYRSTTAALLAMEGLTVATAASGNEAVARVRDGLRPALVLLDQRMPGLSGIEALHALRELGLSAPAVLVSAMPDVDRVALQNGFAAGLNKPFEFDALSALVRSLLAPPSAAVACAEPSV